MATGGSGAGTGGGFDPHKFGIKVIRYSDQSTTMKFTVSADTRISRVHSEWLNKMRQLGIEVDAVEIRDRGDRLLDPAANMQNAGIKDGDELFAKRERCLCDITSSDEEEEISQFKRRKTSVNQINKQDAICIDDDDEEPDGAAGSTEIAVTNQVRQAEAKAAAEIAAAKQGQARAEAKMQADAAIAARAKEEHSRKLKAKEREMKETEAKAQQTVKAANKAQKETNRVAAIKVDAATKSQNEALAKAAAEEASKKATKREANQKVEAANKAKSEAEANAQAQVAAAAAAAQTAKEATENLDRAEEDSECCICMAEKKRMVVVPCYHHCLCISCAEDFPGTLKLCPICQQQIQSIRRIFS